MSPPLSSYQHRLIARWVDNRPAATALLALNTRLGVRLACLLASCYLIWLFRQVATLSEWVLLPRGMALVTSVLALGYLVSAFSGWAHGAIQRRMAQQIAEVLRELNACTALMAAVGAAAGGATANKRRSRRPRRQAHDVRPTWLQYPVVPILLLFFIAPFLCFKEPAAWNQIISQKLQAAPFLTRAQQVLVIQVNREGEAAYSHAGGPFVPLTDSNRTADLNALRAEGIRTCALNLDAELEAGAFFELRAQLRAAGFETLYIGEKVYFRIF